MQELDAPVLRREGRNVVPMAVGQFCLQGA
jgi:hypothetical protein